MECPLRNNLLVSYDLNMTNADITSIDVLLQDKQVEGETQI